MTGGRTVLASVLASVALWTIAACLTRPLPLGEALLVVDTNASIPRHVNRLRVDVFGGRGELLETRELVAPRGEDWPISFSVVADREEPRAVTVRLRAYADGHVVTRRESAQDGGAELLAHRTLDDACQQAPKLAFGEPLTVRRGAAPITTILPVSVGDAGTCLEPTTDAGAPPPRCGSGVAKVEIAARGKYRFEVVAISPDGTKGEPGGNVALALRKECLLPTTQLACEGDATSDTRLPVLTLDLDPGTYWLVTGGWGGAAADVTLLATGPESVVEAPPTPTVGDPDALEPAPGATIDRLVRLQLVQGYRGTVPVTLSGECFGTPADLTTGRTCIDREGELVAPAPLVADGDLVRDVPRPPPWEGERSEPCAIAPRGPSAVFDEEVCIPGGAFLLGDTLALTDRDFRTRPERMRVVAPFLLDRYEFTVARYREALRRGFVPAGEDPRPNPGPLKEDCRGCACTFSVDAPTEGPTRESYPLNCVTWSTARALCRFFEGDLPTEDQWEYAATAAGRPLETQYPWGSALPACDLVAVERASADADKPAARCATFGPVAVDAAPFADRDRSPAGVVGLGGNVMELLATGFYRYDSVVWARAGLRAPIADVANQDAPLRSARGGDWATSGASASAAVRRAVAPLANYQNLGFRCARRAR